MSATETRPEAPATTASPEPEAAPQRVPTWVKALAPLLLVFGLVVAFLAFDPVGQLQDVPPTEALVVERARLGEDTVELTVRNDGPDEVEVAQVLVNTAYWVFEIDDPTIGPLETSKVSLDYPWEEGLPLEVNLLTSTGATFTHSIEVAALTPELDGRTFGIYGLLGVYIGVIPVAVGLLWFSALRQARRRWLSFFLAFTLGLLGFLLVDSFAEGLELAGETASSLDGLSLFAAGALVAVLGLVWLEGALRRRRAGSTGLTGAYLVSAGIGLHNLGEGLAVGAALAAGEAALGAFLVIGFGLHNTTEGLAIVAPLGDEPGRPALKHFAALGLLAGGPAVLGAWAGGYAFNPAWASLAFGVAAGAIVLVLFQIGRGQAKRGELSSGPGVLGLAAGFAFMYVTGLLTFA